MQEPSSVREPSEPTQAIVEVNNSLSTQLPTPPETKESRASETATDRQQPSTSVPAAAAASSNPAPNAPTNPTISAPGGKATESTPPVVNPMDQHANERTFNSWQRTSAAYLVIGIALAKFFKGLTAIAGFVFFLIGCVIVVFAAIRFESKRSHIDKFEYPAETVGPWIVTLCTVGVGILSLAALWSGGKPISIKNGRLIF